jgi:hypothetical protein
MGVVHAFTVTAAPAAPRLLAGRLLMKLGAHDQAQLVMIAYETRLVIPG